MLAVWLSTQNHGSMLISDRQTVPFLPANPEYSATRNQVSVSLCLVSIVIRMTTCLENRKNGELSGNFTAVQEMSGISVKIRGMPRKKSCQAKLPKNFPKYCIGSLTFTLCQLFYAVYCCMLLTYLLVSNIYMCYDFVCSTYL